MVMAMVMAMAVVVAMEMKMEIGNGNSNCISDGSGNGNSNGNCIGNANGNRNCHDKGKDDSKWDVREITMNKEKEKKTNKTIKKITPSPDIPGSPGSPGSPSPPWMYTNKPTNNVIISYDKFTSWKLTGQFGRDSNSVSQFWLQTISDPLFNPVSVYSQIVEQLIWIWYRTEKQDVDNSYIWASFPNFTKISVHTFVALKENNK